MDSTFLGSVDTVRGDVVHTQYEFAIRSTFRPQSILQKQLQLLQKNGLDHLHILSRSLERSVRKHYCFTWCDDVPKVTQGEYRRTMLSLSVQALWHCKLALCRPRCGLTASLRSYRAVGQRFFHTPWQDYPRIGEPRRSADQLCSTPSRSISASARRSHSKTRSPLQSPAADTSSNNKSKACMVWLKTWVAAVQGS